MPCLDEEQQSRQGRRLLERLNVLQLIYFSILSSQKKLDVNNHPLTPKIPSLAGDGHIEMQHFREA